MAYAQVNFQVFVNGQSISKNFKKSVRVFMNSTWNRFNSYANLRGFTKPVSSSEYLGALAWQNPYTLEIMELRSA